MWLAARVQGEKPLLWARCCAKGLRTFHLILHWKETCLQVKKPWPRLYGKRRPGAPSGPVIRGLGPVAAQLASPPGSTTRQRHCYFQEIPPRLGEAAQSQQVLGLPGTGRRALSVKGGSKAGCFLAEGQPWGDAGHRLPSTLIWKSAPVSSTAAGLLTCFPLPACLSQDHCGGIF